MCEAVTVNNRIYTKTFSIGAAYTYYKTLCQEDSLKRRGKATDRNKVRRRRERTQGMSVSMFISSKFRMHSHFTIRNFKSASVYSRKGDMSRGIKKSGAKY